MKHGEYMIFFYKKRSEDECKLDDKLDYLKKLEHDLYWAKFNRKHLKGAVRNALRDTRKYSGKNLDQAREMLIICRNEEHENYVNIGTIEKEIVDLKNKISNLRSKIN